MMHIGCAHLRELLASQQEIIKRHIDRHKWFRHIEDPEAAIADFIEKFGWIMRDFYCTRICGDRAECAEPLRLTHGTVEPDTLLTETLARSETGILRGCTHLEELIESQRPIIERHLDTHKWLQRIEDRDVAIRHFVDTFGWIMLELYCTKICPDRLHCAESIRLRAQSPPC